MREPEKPAPADDDAAGPSRGEQRLEVLMPPDLKKRVQARAKAERMPAAVLARLAIEEFLARRERSAAA